MRTRAASSVTVAKAKPSEESGRRLAADSLISTAPLGPLAASPAHGAGSKASAGRTSWSRGTSLSSAYWSRSWSLNSMPVIHSA